MKSLILRNIKWLSSSPAGSTAVRSCIKNFITSESHQSRRFRTSARRQIVKPYLLADIGEGITECQIISWSVKPGDRVEQFDQICEVQSDKASVEITSRFDGVVKALHYQQNDMAIVGKPLIDIDIEGDDIAIEEDSAESVEHENRDGRLEEAEEMTKIDIQKTAGPTEPQILEKANGVLPPPVPQALPDIPPPPRKGAGLVTPAVRHLIRKHNLEVADIQGTGKDGRVLVEDVQRYLSVKEAAQPKNTDSKTLNSVPKAGTEDRVHTLTPIESQMFKVMTHSLTIPHFLYTHNIDCTSLNSLRKRYNSKLLLTSTPELVPKLTLLPFILKALSHTFKQYPKINAHLNTDNAKPEFVLKGNHDFGIAIDTPSGLLVPVIRDIQSLSILEIASELTRISQLANSGKLQPEDFRGATFTVSNIGNIGGNVVAPVIVAPMVGILGVGRVEDVPVFETGVDGIERVVKRERIVLSWSADHRVLDGATVARCAESLGRLLEGVEGLMLGLK